MSKIKTSVKKLPDSRVEIAVTLPIEMVMEFRTKALSGLQETVKIDGFRPGKVPESKIMEKIGETGLLAEMADLALTEHYPTIIIDTKVSPIGRPQISVTKLAPENDVEYVIATDVLPTIELKDVAKLAKAKNAEPLENTVTDVEIENAIKELRQMRAHQKMHDDGVEHHDHNHQNIADADLPEMDDAFVKTLGDFATVEDFKTKLRENLMKEKESHSHEKRRVEIIESIIAAGTFDIPASMVDYELDKMLEQFKYDLSMSGMKIDEYLGHIGKSIDALKVDWREQAVKRVQMQLALESIAKEFDIKPEAEKVDAQVAQILEMYKDQAIEEANVVAYVTQMLTNAAVFDWLEMQK